MGMLIPPSLLMSMRNPAQITRHHDEQETLRTAAAKFRPILALITLVPGGLYGGLLTPPFGVSVYTVKSALNETRITHCDILAGALPFVLALVAVLALLVAPPKMSAWLAHL